jgi:hypothetical protein
MPRRRFSYAAPIGFGEPVASSLAQESLPGVFGNVQVGTTGGTAAALDGKAIKPTPRAPAAAITTAARFLNRMYSSFVWAASGHPMGWNGFRLLVACLVAAVKFDFISH